MDFPTRFANEWRELTTSSGKALLGVSGGGDSMALLLLAAREARKGGPEVIAASVNHGLREEAADEVLFVKSVCESLGVKHVSLKWSPPEKMKNVQQEARNARIDLLSKAAIDHGCDVIALGHNEDDVAENVLIRKERGDELGYLSMAKRRERRGVVWVRPMLTLGRDEIRAWLHEQGQKWVDDPSNESDAYARVRARKRIKGEKGLRERLLEEARLSEIRAREEVKKTADFVKSSVQVGQMGEVYIVSPPEDDETLRRVLGAVSRFCGNLSSQVRGPKLMRAVDNMRALKGGFSLNGSVFSRYGDGWVATREAARCPDDVALTGGRLIWDERWEIDAGDTAGGRVFALGDDYSRIHKGKRDNYQKPVLTGLPQVVLRDGVYTPLDGNGPISFTCLRDENLLSALVNPVKDQEKILTLSPL